ncbi:MAG: hypothetical protein IPH03_11575 [Tetrasphaera sp.]|nr:hypothetical protein [Tetrasphaera sp.]
MAIGSVPSSMAIVAGRSASTGRLRRPPPRAARAGSVVCRVQPRVARRGGEVVGIPPERHAVDALEDSVFLLTVALAAR